MTTSSARTILATALPRGIIGAVRADEDPDLLEG